jgi:hypothetical protein
VAQVPQWNETNVKNYLITAHGRTIKNFAQHGSEVTFDKIIPGQVFMVTFHGAFREERDLRSLL